MVSGVKIISSKKSVISQSHRNMASKQMMRKPITRAVAEATRVALQTMVEKEHRMQQDPN